MEGRTQHRPKAIIGNAIVRHERVDKILGNEFMAGLLHVKFGKILSHCVTMCKGIVKSDATKKTSIKSFFLAKKSCF